MLRFACESDTAALLSIYAQYIQPPVTFETVLPSEQDFCSRIAAVSSFYPYLVAEDAGAAVGYAYAHRQMDRAAYGWNAELSVYLAPSACSRGLGKKLYGALFEILRLQGVKTVYGGVTVPNARSEALHVSCGFRLIGVYQNTGFKCGAWHNVAWFEKQIAPYDTDPVPPVGISMLDAAAVRNILAKYSL